jgi:threonine dehydratase
MRTDAPPTLADVREAAARIKPFAHRTPVLTCSSLDAMVGASLFFKCENFQKVGAFKFRGACNAVFSLQDREARRGVATHSSGNHAAALSLAARLRGIPAHVVMPRTSRAVKQAAVAGYGGRIVLCEPTLAAREATLADVVAGTAALELLEDIPGLDVVMTPVGGGGLLSGTAISVTALSPATRVVAAEPKGADDAFRSLQEGRIVPSVDPQTICDGLLTSLGTLTFAIIRERVERIVTVSDASTIAAMRHIWERMKIVIEPSAAVTLGALLEGTLPVSGLRVGVILSGGNVDLSALPWGAEPVRRG